MKTINVNGLCFDADSRVRVVICGKTTIMTLEEIQKHAERGAALDKESYCCEHKVLLRGRNTMALEGGRLIDYHCQKCQYKITIKQTFERWAQSE